jgi:hypothetical protein
MKKCRQIFTTVVTLFVQWCKHLDVQQCCALISYRRQKSSDPTSCEARPLPRPSYLQEACREWRNFLWRLGILRRTKLHRHGIALVSYEERIGLSRENYRKLLRARMLCIRSFLTIHPAASLVDLHLLTRSLPARILIPGVDRTVGRCPPYISDCDTPGTALDKETIPHHPSR